MFLKKISWFKKHIKSGIFLKFLTLLAKGTLYNTVLIITAVDFFQLQLMKLKFSINLPSPCISSWVSASIPLLSIEPEAQQILNKQIGKNI
jgi:hypothetical protein